MSLKRFAQYISIILNSFHKKRLLIIVIIHMHMYNIELVVDKMYTIMITVTPQIKPKYDKTTIHEDGSGHRGQSRSAPSTS